MILNFILNDRFLAVLGTTMIIVATVLTDKIIDNINSEIYHISTTLSIQHENILANNLYSNFSTISFELANIGKEIREFDLIFSKDDNIYKDLLSKHNAYFSAGLSQSVVGKYIASRQNFSKAGDFFNNIEKLRKKNNENSILELFDYYIKYSGESGRYISSLYKKRAALIFKLTDKMNSLGTYRNIAIFFQIFGMIILLFREFPQKISLSR